LLPERPPPVPVGQWLRCCKLRASRVLESGSIVVFDRGVHPWPGLSRSPTSPDIPGVPSRCRLLPVRLIGGRLVPRPACAWPWFCSRGSPSRLNDARAGCARRSAPEFRVLVAHSARLCVALLCSSCSGGPPLRDMDIAFGMPARPALSARLPPWTASRDHHGTCGARQERPPGRAQAPSTARMARDLRAKSAPAAERQRVQRLGASQEG
jgi:hypothetical protein